MAKKHETIEVGSGDVFVDLGFADAGERKLRVKLAMLVNELIARRCSISRSRMSRSSSITSSADFPPSGCCGSLPYWTETSRS
jgi:hypothetical protein